MAKAVGIGGIFLHFKGDEKELFKWYQVNLGLKMSPYGTGFIEGEQLVLLSFKRSSNEGPYINFRVDDIEELIIKFKSEGLRIVKDIEEFEYGKFAQIEDPFTNIIELWEPNVEVYKKMVRKEIEDYKQKMEIKTVE
jgi:predicted enzyme related to lactoylglutathione lyase